MAYQVYSVNAICGNCGRKIYGDTVTTENIDDWLAGFKGGEINCECGVTASLERD